MGEGMERGLAGLCWVEWRGAAGACALGVFIVPPSIGRVDARAGAGLRIGGGKVEILRREWGKYFLFLIEREVRGGCRNAQQM
jgi:hypothetical protein